MYGIEQNSVQEAALSCVLQCVPSVVLGMSNPEALTPTTLPPPASCPLPHQTPLSGCLGLPDEHSVPPWASVLQMSSIILLLQMSKAGLLALCVFPGVVHVVWGDGAHCVAATALPPSFNVIQCINV